MTGVVHTDTTSEVHTHAEGEIYTGTTGEVCIVMTGEVCVLKRARCTSPLSCMMRTFFRQLNGIAFEFVFYRVAYVQKTKYHPQK